MCAYEEVFRNATRTCRALARSNEEMYKRILDSTIVRVFRQAITDRVERIVRMMPFTLPVDDITPVIQWVTTACCVEQLAKRSMPAMPRRERVDGKFTSLDDVIMLRKSLDRGAIADCNYLTMHVAGYMTAATKVAHDIVRRYVTAHNLHAKGVTAPRTPSPDERVAQS